VKLLIDEMYPPALADGLRDAGIDATTVGEIGLAGSSDPNVFAAAISLGRVLLTENVADFARIAAEHLNAGDHHPGLIIALSSRFSRRAAARKPLIDAIAALAAEQLADRVIYLQHAHRA
jgi:hypothetical protein